MVSMVCLGSVPLRELAMATEEPMELASRRVPANCCTDSGWFPARQIRDSGRTTSNDFGRLGRVGSRGMAEGGGYVVCGVHGLRSGGSSGGIDVEPRLGFGS